MARKVIDYGEKEKKGGKGIREKTAYYKSNSEQIQTLLRYKSFEVQNFRCIKKLAISPWNRSTSLLV